MFSVLDDILEDFGSSPDCDSYDLQDSADNILYFDIDENNFTDQDSNFTYFDIFEENYFDTNEFLFSSELLGSRSTLLSSNDIQGSLFSSEMSNAFADRSNGSPVSKNKCNNPTKPTCISSRRKRKMEDSTESKMTKKSNNKLDKESQVIVTIEEVYVSESPISSPGEVDLNSPPPTTPVYLSLKREPKTSSSSTSASKKQSNASPTSKVLKKSEKKHIYQKNSQKNSI